MAKGQARGHARKAKVDSDMTKMIKATVALACTSVLLLPAESAEGASDNTVEATLNGLRITFDADSGSIIGLE